MAIGGRFQEAVCILLSCFEEQRRWLQGVQTDRQQTNILGMQVHGAACVSLLIRLIFLVFENRRYFLKNNPDETQIVIRLRIPPAAGEQRILETWPC